MRRLTMVYLGGIIMGIGLATIPIQAIIDEYSLQHSTGVVGAIQMTFLIGMGIIAVAVLMARPGLLKTMGFGGLGFFMAIAVIAAIGYIFIGSLLGGG